MNDRHWIRITEAANIPAREGRAITVGRHELAIFNLDGRYLTIENKCPHKGGPLCDGIVTGESVVCPLHAWKVNLANGCVERPTHGKDHCVTTYPVRVDDDNIVVVGLPISSPRRAEASASAEGAAA